MGCRGAAAVASATHLQVVTGIFPIVTFVGGEGLPDVLAPNSRGRFGSYRTASSVCVGPIQTFVMVTSSPIISVLTM